MKLVGAPALELVGHGLDSAERRRLSTQAESPRHSGLRRLTPTRRGRGDFPANETKLRYSVGTPSLQAASERELRLALGVASESWELRPRAAGGAF